MGCKEQYASERACLWVCAVDVHCILSTDQTIESVTLQVLGITGNGRGGEDCGYTPKGKRTLQYNSGPFCSCHSLLYCTCGLL